MGTFALASVGFIVLVIVVAIAFAAGQRRGVRRRPKPYTDDPTGYTPGVWLLGGADSTKPGDHHHGSSHGHASHGGHGDAGAAGGDGGGAGGDGGGGN
jgi:hypothetical protein